MPDPIAGRVQTELTELQFIIPPISPYSDLEPEELELLMHRITNVGNRMLMIYSMMIVSPERFLELTDRAINATFDMIKEEVVEQGQEKTKLLRQQMEGWDEPEEEAGEEYQS